MSTRILVLRDPPAVTLRICILATKCVYVFHMTHNKYRLIPCTALTDLSFLIEEFVLWKLGTQVLHIIWMNVRPQRVKIITFYGVS
jgi:hypothetical protein